MKKFINIFTVFVFLLIGCFTVKAQKKNKLSKHETQVVGSVESSRSLAKEINILKSDGGRVEWSPDGKYIYIDRKDSKRYFDVYRINSDGSNEVCLTCDTDGVVPSGHNGQPAIHPNGKYLVFQAQKKEHVGKGGRDLAAQPGLGRYHDLWLLNFNTNKFFQLTNLPDAHNTGILHPHFSKDGKKLTWTQMYNSSKNLWRLKVADFSVDKSGKPKLSNIQTYEPGGESFYENHGLSPDGNKIIFTANFIKSSNPLDFFKQKIHTYDFKTKELVTLADERYNESAHYAPIGKKIVWFNSVGNKNRGTDYWMMNYDGSGKTRITDFNNPKNSSYKWKTITSADLSFSPDGKKMVAYLQTNLLTQNGMTVIIDLKDDWYKSASDPNSADSTSLVKSIKKIEEKGGRLGLSPDGNTVVYDKRGEDKYFDIWTMDINGSNKKCLTCDNPSLPTRNVGQPEWHPSGKYIIVQVEKQEHHEGLVSGLSANPGAGYYNDIWVIDYPSNKAYPLHIVPEGKEYGVLHPHFSKDGKKLSWSQAFKSADIFDPARLAGSWKLKVADVIIKTDGSMAIDHIKTYQPGDDVIYENHGFSPDNKLLIFTSNLKSNHPVLNSDIYTLDLETEKLNQLTDTGYNEHGQFSPDGTKIIWMSTNGNVEPDEVKEIGYTDWWIMNADGTNKERLTYFNQKGHPHFVFDGICAADFAWYPNSKGIVGYYFTNLTVNNLLTRKFKEIIVAIDLK